MNFSQTILLDHLWKLTAKFVGGRSHCGQVSGVSWDGTMAGADLGHSSNYSNELQFGLPLELADASGASVQNFEIRSEKGFLKSGNQFRVSRS